MNMNININIMRMNEAVGLVGIIKRRSQRINAFEFLKRAIYSIVSNNRVIRDRIFDCAHHYLRHRSTCVIRANCSPVHVTMEYSRM